MTRKEKQIEIEDKYKSRLADYGIIYKEKTEFASKFKLPEKKKKKNSSESAESLVDNNTGITIVGGSELGRKIAKEAATFVGKCVYRWGGKDPTTGGADCSGFTYYIYKKIADVSIGGSTTQQDTAGSLISTSLEPNETPLPGDLIMFQGTYRAAVSHVGIVYSWPKIVHCAGREGTDGVQWSDMSTDKYWRTHFRSIRRVIKDNGKEKKNNKNDNQVEAQSLRILNDTPEENISQKVEKPFLVDDDYGMDIHLLNGGERTTSPGAPIGLTKTPLSWYDVPSKYRPINAHLSTFKIKPLNNISRALFFHERIKWAESTNYVYMKKLNPKKFIHLGRHDEHEGNLYSPDAAIAFEILRLKSKKDKFEILSGFRYSNESLISPHEAGCAIDIKVRGLKEAQFIADLAWSIGFRAIAIGGDVNNNTGFVHVDIGPKKLWNYGELGVYSGPGRWINNEVQ